MVSKLDVVFLGSSSFVVPILQNILENQNQLLSDLFARQLDLLTESTRAALKLPSNWRNVERLRTRLQLKLVVSQPDRLLRQKIISNPVSDFARQNGLDLFTPNNLNKEFEQSQVLRDGFDFGLVASFGQIISQKILGRARYGFINWHPSKLPLYRGATPMQTALADGQTQTALSWLQMTKDMDAGDIWLQIDKDLPATQMFQELATSMGILGSQTWAIPLALELLRVDHPGLQPQPQNQEQATFCTKLSKQDAIVELHQLSAEQLFNHWRAYHLFPGTRFFDPYFGQNIKVAKLAAWYTSQQYEQMLQDPQNTFLGQAGNWQQIKMREQVKTFLLPQSGVLEVVQIVLESGKNLNFRGYRFGSTLVA